MPLSTLPSFLSSLLSPESDDEFEDPVSVLFVLPPPLNQLETVSHIEFQVSLNQFSPDGSSLFNGQVEEWRGSFRPVSIPRLKNRT